MTRIGIAGITGRMGTLLVQAIPDAGATLSGGITRTGSLSDLARASDVIIDFTTAATAIPHAATLTQARCPWVLGTTGLTPEAQRTVTEAARHIPIVQAANFSPGVTILLAAAEHLAAALPSDQYDAEIVETHHRQKTDAPSGTALALGKAVATARQTPFTPHLNPAIPRPPNAIGIASLRTAQIVGEHTLLFTSPTDQITLTHTALDRAIFAQGAIRAALWLHGKPPGLYSMRHVLSL